MKILKKKFNKENYIQPHKRKDNIYINNKNKVNNSTI